MNNIPLNNKLLQKKYVKYEVKQILMEFEKCEDLRNNKYNYDSNEKNQELI